MKWLYLVVGLSLLTLGCSDPPGEEIEAEKAALEKKAKALSSAFTVNEGSSGDGLTIKLAFEENADLDLYVTGPMLETVYFANHTSKSGGEITEDVRCDSEGKRIEEVRFAHPIPGRYRVGVDFPEGCEEGLTRAPFAVSVTHDGEEQQVFGTVTLQQFEVVVLEFEL